MGCGEIRQHPQVTGTWKAAHLPKVSSKEVPFRELEDKPHPATALGGCQCMLT